MRFSQMLNVNAISTNMADSLKYYDCLLAISAPKKKESIGILGVFTLKKNDPIARNILRTDRLSAIRMGIDRSSMVGIDQIADEIYPNWYKERNFETSYNKFTDKMYLSVYFKEYINAIKF